MNTPTTPNDELMSIREELNELRQDFSTLLMATVSSEGLPDASYAAYVEEDDDYYVYISELSTHTQNLMANGQASVLFIENELQAGHLFARKRLTLQCGAEEILRGSEEFEAMMIRFAGKFGNLIQTLRELEDFHLFRLRPRRALYVAGFAKAYALDDARLQSIRHIRDRGHRNPKNLDLDRDTAA